MRCEILCAVIWTVAAHVVGEQPGNSTTVADSKGIKNYDHKKYKPDWSDLDTRPLPKWYDRAKIGILLHWGIYSVPAYGTERFWENWIIKENIKVVSFMKKNYPPPFVYEQFAPMFTAKSFNPDKWVRLFKKAGAKYIVLTSKHHDGFCLFPSKATRLRWNSVQTGPHRDLVRDLSRAVKSASLEFGVYYSLSEWFHPTYVKDKKTDFTTHDYRDEKLWPDLKQLVNDYKPSVLWVDGDWAKDTYWNSTHFLAWLYNDSPVKDRIVVNDRWGIGTACKHGDFYNCGNNYHPETLQGHKWESAFSLDKLSWGYRLTIQLSEMLTLKKIIHILVSTVSCGGNVLINIGPTKEGTIDPYFEVTLLELGDWLAVNGEAIYGTSPYVNQKDSSNDHVWYTCKKKHYDAQHPTAIPENSNEVTAIYAIFLEWPQYNLLKLGSFTHFLNTTIRYDLALLGDEKQKLNWAMVDTELVVDLHQKAKANSKHAWTLKMVRQEF